jgi:RNA polymerase sigma-70 factor (ECF subfamily)
MNNVEKEIISGLSQGNRDIFNIVFKSFYSLLCAYARELVKSYQTAEEIVQDVFVKLWENHSRLHIETSLKAYLYRSVYNGCLNFIRDTKKTSYQHVDIHNSGYLDELVTEEPEWLSSPERIDRMEDAIKRTIHELPEQCRQIFILCRHEHLSYPQIAEKLGVSLSTVKTQMGRAMSRLKEAVDAIKE